MTSDTPDLRGPDQIFRAALDEGRVLLQRDPVSGTLFFFPRATIPGRGVGTPDWVEVSGAGIVYSTTVSRRRPEQGGNRNIAIIELIEGPRLMSQVTGIDPEEVKIGMPVHARIEHSEDGPVLRFAPAEGAA